MAKILTIKINDKNHTCDIKSYLPEGMTEAELNEHLAIALPMAVAALAKEMSDGSPLAGRAAILAMFEMADSLLTEMMDEEEEDDEGPCCCNGVAECDDHS